ncbi:MAG: Gfo/Idh/MocA family oxidoreductase [Oscillospiraceae bacterium]|jgi:predicted dehydrogenase|nr:Gfo/Idh/MocA family oxidoreductase [Oscillospiraceae bacterium]
MLRVAIIGNGNISYAHVRGYLDLGDRCKITHLVDIVPSKSEAQKQMFDLDCQIHDDHRAILDAEDVDLVSVCTPPYVHAEIAINFLKAGKHVICEKPMAPSLAAGSL